MRHNTATRSLRHRKAFKGMGGGGYPETPVLSQNETQLEGPVAPVI
jgi:hypothetical protein